MLPLPLNQEDDSLKTIHRSNHNDGEEWESTGSSGDEIDNVANVDTGCGKNDCTYIPLGAAP